MSFEDSQQTERVTHATLVFEREVPATVEKVFSAFANAKIRSEWGAPSDTATIIYDQADFREGGEDRFRCGSQSNPNIYGMTHYLEIILNLRIVSSETILMDGKCLCVSLITLELVQSGSRTKLRSTSQVASFIGQDMIQGAEIGNNSSLDSLVNYFSRGQA
ncbi:MAG: SRPBCC domain-containing protein [Prochlorococcaceae cyanobacterium]